jgi:hypothetical protein
VYIQGAKKGWAMNGEQEIEVTAEMIEAGVRALRGWSDELKNWEGAYDDEIVGAIIRAALKASAEARL